MPGKFDQDFEAGIRLIREAYQKKVGLIVAAKDEEITHMRAELAKKDAEIKDLTMRFQTVTNQYNQVQKRMNDMSKAVAKLASFKQSVMASLADDTDLDLSGEGRASNSIGGLGRAGFGIDADRSGMSDEITGHGSFIGDSTTRLFGRTSTGERSYERQPDDSFATVSTSPPSHHTLHCVPSTENFRTITGLPPSTPSTKPSSLHQHQQQQHQHQQQQHQQHQQEKRKPNGVTFAGIDAVGRSSASVLDSSPSTGVAGGCRTDSSGTVDGKEFFRKARARLSYDEFTQLLWNVKAYNSKRQSRIRTLDVLSGLFGDKHRDLYEHFQHLVSTPGIT